MQRNKTFFLTTGARGAGIAGAGAGLSGRTGCRGADVWAAAIVSRGSRWKTFLSILFDFIQKKTMDTRIFGQFRMEGGHHVAALFDEYGIAAILRQNSRLRADTPDDGRSNEDCFEIAV